MMWCPVSPMFAPARSSSMSRSRTCEPLMEYSLVPSRNAARSIETSSKSILNCRRPARPGELSKTMATAAREARGAWCEPPQMRSSALLPLMLFIDCSPSAKRKASATLLFPEPFGPTIAVIAFEYSKTVFLGNDLNPAISSRFSIWLLLYQKKTALGWRAIILFARIARIEECNQPNDCGYDYRYNQRVKGGMTGADNCPEYEFRCESTGHNPTQNRPSRCLHSVLLKNSLAALKIQSAYQLVLSRAAWAADCSASCLDLPSPRATSAGPTKTPTVKRLS